MSTSKIIYIYRFDTLSETITRKSLRNSKFRQIKWAVVRGRCRNWRCSAAEVQVQRCRGEEVKRCSCAEVNRCRGGEQVWRCPGSGAEVQVQLC